MSPRLLRPIQNTHPEAADWANRVRTNGGSVSGSTLVAVSKFCRAIDAAGIRDRFYRLNLFCGASDASLNAVRTPLYRGQSRTGTQYGGTTDTNTGNLFQQADYAENNGLLGNTTTKWLNTGFNMNTAGLTVGSPGVHMSVVFPAYTHGASQNTFPISAINAAVNERFWLNFNAKASHTEPTTEVQSLLGTGGSSLATKTIAATNGAAIPGGLWIVSRTTATDLKLYNGATEQASNGNSAASFSTVNNDMSIFARWTGSTTFGHWGYRMRGYSVGLGMTAQQVSDFNNAMTTVQTALGRT